MHKVRISLIGLCLALLIIAPLQNGADTLPAQISDQEFWRMISDFSEPGGSFRYENFLSNELSIQRVIPALKARTQPGGAYLGVAPEQNFTYIAALQPRIAFIIDIRRQNMVEHLLYKALFELSSNRADFVARLFSRKRPAGLGSETSVLDLFTAYEKVPGDGGYYDQNLIDVTNTLAKHGFPLSSQDLQTIHYVYNVFYRGGPSMNYGFASPSPNSLTPSYVRMMTSTDLDGRYWSYLAAEDSFRYVKEMQRKNLIVPLVGDFGGPAVIRNVGSYLKDHSASVTAFYVSNVERYLSGALWQTFYRNVATLPVNDSSVFIRFVDNDYTRLMRGWTPAKDVQTVLVPMKPLIDFSNAGRLPGYTELIARDTALP